MTMTISGSSGLIFPDGSGQETGIGRNRIINGAMVIDQRNAGASITPSSSGTTYTIDRWKVEVSIGSKISIQQNAGSITPPTGFKNYLGVTSLAATSVGSTDYYILSQNIEGFNVADLDFGTANAKTITLSFWVRSSLTGTFGGVLYNDAGNPTYPFTYTISSANTWEQKTITITGSTTGTWLTTNGIGLSVVFGLGAGSSVSGTSGSWQAALYRNATGATSVVGTNGATFYITGVQLEVGTSATPFERRLYGQELALCQRYYFTQGLISGLHYGVSAIQASNLQVTVTQFPQQMRATPTFTSSSASTFTCNVGGAGSVVSGDVLTQYTASWYVTSSGAATNGYASRIFATNTSSYIAFSAEL